MSTRTLIIAIAGIVAVAFLLDALHLPAMAWSMLFLLGAVIGFFAGARKGDQPLGDRPPADN
jgi:hypothetical protein